MRLTLLLAALLVLLYVALSGFSVYTPAEVWLALGFSFSNLVGLLTYSFVHIGPAHLIGNIVVLLAVGFIAESLLKKKDFIAIYVLASIGAGICFALFAPGVIVIGSSAAIAGLIAVAFFINFKRALILVPLTIIISSAVVTPVAASIIGGIYSQTLEKQAQLEDTYIVIQQERNQTQEDFLNNRINITEYEQIIENISIKENQTITELNQTIQTSNNLDQGIEMERTATVASLSHVVGAIIGSAYLVMFRRDIIWRLPSQFSAFGRLRAKSRPSSKAKSSRKRSR